MPNHQDRNGFTLVELLIVLAIIAIILSVIVQSCKSKQQSSLGPQQPVPANCTREVCYTLGVK
ncbi:MAG: prepilin-type N-terminal cleavage/methylation domain-containing protein [bacterium]|nr:prepilin-type N-terminal cleavage/methylation domain-containing protein [bacterium]